MYLLLFSFTIIGIQLHFPENLKSFFSMCSADQSAGKKMRRYINASVPVIEYIDELFISRNIKLNWWIPLYLV